MLVVTAFELGHPVLLVVEMEADDASIHGGWVFLEQRRGVTHTGGAFDRYRCSPHVLWREVGHRALASRHNRTSSVGPADAS
jgi:hypothetical protein